jgi:lipoprotein-releasing system ATP-binding protein
MSEPEDPVSGMPAPPDPDPGLPSWPTEVPPAEPAPSVPEAPSPGPPADARPVLLGARGVSKAYKVAGTRLEVLRGVDLDIREGEILAILGKSGCGKSTLLHVLGWLDRADAGEIHYEGQDRNRLPARERARQRNVVMGFVFQFYHLMPELSALENVLIPAFIRHDRFAWRVHRRAATERARALLAMVGLGHRMTHRPAQLSGGERQRVAIARALQNAPRFLLCDEPTGNLDGRTAEDVRALLWGLNRTHGQTMVIVTHDARLADQAHRVVHLVDGRVATEAPEAPLVETLPDT